MNPYQIWPAVPVLLRLILIVIAVWVVHFIIYKFQDRPTKEQVYTAPATPAEPAKTKSVPTRW